jgi:hypothetical protein
MRYAVRVGEVYLRSDDPITEAQCEHVRRALARMLVVRLASPDGREFDLALSVSDLVTDILAD